MLQPILILMNGDDYRLVFSFMLFCIAAVQYEIWCMYGARHTYQLDRLRSKAGQIREGMAAFAAADPLPALAGAMVKFGVRAQAATCSSAV